ncbi:anion exchange protein 2-like isoform X2 [Mytilus californianus]|nr:anion exchange protein 2-like isoform X2 [Mytilus californianus]XP_052080369.1 anion exchange protein 2-like isoform X2 [Mytilus californianus]XP_052080370.1 anion exchange protein 2-like isoform X2 [Mytilus californianus]XP_052080371.1 anion exchange protein 2-like isoform X2 [Mytilus californianus]XP_052080372.1 anion exchange protein 2-like isoform X2 [Mytilus californianus]
MALLGRDNSEDLNYIKETEPFLSTSSSHGGSLETEGRQEIAPLPGPIPCVSTAPVPFSQLEVESRPRLSSFRSSFNEDVEKLFSMPEKFDITALSSGSELVTSNRSDPNFQTGAQVMEKQFLDDIEVENFSNHRTSRFPHQHHPLKAMRSKSFKHSRPSQEKVKKKKKKKKRKMKTPKSFPSRSALLSPTIHEVENEEDHSLDQSSSDSSDETDGMESETERQENGVTYTLMDTGVHQPESENFIEMERSDSVDLIEKERSTFRDLISSETTRDDPVESINELKRQGSEPNDFKLDLSDDDRINLKDSPAIILTSPSPVHFEYPSSPVTSSALKPQFQVGPVSSGASSVEDLQHLGKVWPTNQSKKSEKGSIDDDKVVFYFGDTESVSSQKNTPKRTFYLADENSLSSRKKESDIGSFNSVTSSVSQPADTESIYSGTSVSRGPPETNWTDVLSDTSAEPVLSQSASQEGAKSMKEAVGSSKVKFHMGMDEDLEPPNKVTFKMGADSNSNLEALDKENDPSAEQVIHNNNRRGSRSSDGRPHKHRHHHHHHEHYKQEDLLLRRQKGSEVHLDKKLQRVPTEADEANLLHTADLDEMASHRLENLQGIRRHKINRKKRNAMASIVHIGKADKAKKKFYKEPRKKFDHSPHEVFVELDELYVGESKEFEWREKARWIKFEEDVEEGAERWGKPHVASLSFHSLLELRRGLENGTMLLDIEATDLPTIVNNIIDSMIIHDQIKPENKGNILRTLLLKHKHVGQRENFIRRNFSYMNLRGLDRYRHQSTKHSLMKSLSTASFRSVGSQNSLDHNDKNFTRQDSVKEKLLDDNHQDTKGKLEFVKVDVDNNMPSDGVHIGITPAQDPRQKNIQDIMRRIPKGAEATTVLVGCVDYLTKPAVAFVRLAEGQYLDNLTEVPLPVRFLFLLLGPENSGMDYHEVGRSISTLMSNQHFHDVAYKAESRRELLGAINEFLDESIVLPPGDWDQKTLLPIMDMARKKARLKRRKQQKEEEKQALLEKEKKDKIPLDPLRRTRKIFGGLYYDIKRRYPHYISDFKDGFNLKCLAAIVFIFFACFAPCIAFGGLLSEKTYDYLGVKETVISTSVCGIIFALLAGQPLMLVGATGPVLVFEQSLYMFCKNNNIEFLTMRVWIGFWVMLISIVAVAAESSFLVRHISRFTEEIFAILISLIFIFEVIKKIDETFKDHPLLLDYCAKNNLTNSSLSSNGNVTLYPVLNVTSLPGYTFANDSFPEEAEDDTHYNKYLHYKEVKNRPNTALMSTILTLGTFLIAYFLRIFRNSKFLGRRARRALGDFGIVISIILMVLLDLSIGESVYTQKLQVPPTLEPTLKRGWVVNPVGTKKRIEVYIIFASFIPAALIFMLLYLETQITEMILNKKELKMKKGSGFHLDMVLVGVMTFMCSLFGLPWMCPATVRTIAHVSALSVMSRHHAPGEKPKLMEVKEQRVTALVMNIIIGISLFWEPVLKAVPMAVLFGVFLYLGISSLSGVQMFKRLKLLLIPVKYHPSRGFVRRVKTMKMHLFTIIQLVLLVMLLIIKSTAAALAFPLFVILLVPLRISGLPRIFTGQELHELDQEEEDSDDEDIDDPDFYQLAHMPV